MVCHRTNARVAATRGLYSSPRSRWQGLFGQAGVVMHNFVVDLAVVIQNQPNVMLTITTATRMERGTARISPASRNRVSLSLNNRYASYACFVGRSCEPLIRFQGLSEPPRAHLVPTAVLIVRRLRRLPLRARAANARCSAPCRYRRSAAAHSLTPCLPDVC